MCVLEYLEHFKLNSTKIIYCDNFSYCGLPKLRECFNVDYDVCIYCGINKPFGISVGYLSNSCDIYIPTKVFSTYYCRGYKECLTTLCIENMDVNKIKFGNTFNSNVNDIPEHILTIEFGNNFNRTVNNLPKKLQNLTLGSSFNNKIDKLPQNLLTLTLHYSFNDKMDKFPQNLKNLTFRYVGLLNYEFFPKAHYLLNDRNENMLKKLQNFTFSHELYFDRCSFPNKNRMFDFVCSIDIDMLIKCVENLTGHHTINRDMRGWTSYELIVYEYSSSSCRELKILHGDKKKTIYDYLCSNDKIFSKEFEKMKFTYNIDEKIIKFSNTFLFTCTLKTINSINMYIKSIDFVYCRRHITDHIDNIICNFMFSLKNIKSCEKRCFKKIPYGCKK